MSHWLLHMTTAAAYDESLERAEYRAASLLAEGFIHLSTAEQVHLPANYLFAGRDDIVLLCLEPERLDSTVLWESGDPDDPAGLRFPHLYGPIPIAAVVAVVPYRPGPDGAFGPPVGLPPDPDPRSG